MTFGALAVVLVGCAAVGFVAGFVAGAWFEREEVGDR